MSSEQITPCSDMSSEEALRHLRGLGYKNMDEVPIGAGNDYLNTLVLIAHGYDFGGITFDSAFRRVHDENWEVRDRLNQQKRVWIRGLDY